MAIINNQEEAIQHAEQFLKDHNIACFCFINAVKVPRIQNQLWSEDIIGGCSSTADVWQVSYQIKELKPGEVYMPNSLSVFVESEKGNCGMRI